ncbi:MAG: CoA-binding protein [Planctomycetes bacterium]|nr:CoA-binding protein [Planctomycetota bacterium]
MDGNTIKKILKHQRLAIVGLSDKPHRDSYAVSKYMQEQGYQIVPVNPRADQILGEKSYPNLLETPQDIDIAVIFRKPDAILEIVTEAIQAGVKVVWMQEGIEHQKAANYARQAGLQVVMNKCILKEHQKHK